jgi:capsular polysaccharide biosynthesis protein
MNFLLVSPSLDDLIRLLRAWRVWVLSAILGALVGAAVYFAAPPPYRARATVNVDFNLEQALPLETDRQHFYYLEREARKMVEVAWSDDVLSQLNYPMDDLRAGKLMLSQPAEGGWHFYAHDDDSQTAESLASAWAEAFAQKTKAEVEAGNLNEYIRVEVTQSARLPKERSIPLAAYFLTGALGFSLIAAFGVLFVKPKNE